MEPSQKELATFRMGADRFSGLTRAQGNVFSNQMARLLEVLTSSRNAKILPELSDILGK
jgi:hypothetical protein